MYRKIMVPLDGSELAECVLPHVETVIKGCNIPSIEFIRVVEPAHLPVGTLSDGGPAYTSKDAERDREMIDQQNQAEAENYLKRISSDPRYANATVKTAVLKGSPAAEITDYVEKNQVDLVVIATHGRSGISRWIMGSTADRVLRSVCVPVLMVRAPGCVRGI
jgi:nucleotide-binding universal stress UspA family protein